MKNLRSFFFACFLGCFVPVLSHAQGVFIPPRTVFGTVNGITRPIANATITVCGPNASGTPCSPALAGVLFKDQALTQPLANPTTTDANGNYPQMAIAGGTYTITESAAGFTGFSSQVTVTCAPGAPCTVGAFTATSATITGALTASQVNGRFYVDGVKYTTLNAAFTACNVSPGCRLELPPGNFNFSTQLAPTQPLYLAGSGAMLSNAGSNCTTIITWTGAAVVPISISGTAVSGSILKDFCLNINTATPPPVGIDIDNSANGTRLEHIVMDIPTTPATVAGVRWGNTVGVSDAGCIDTYVRGEPIGYDIIGVRAGWKGVRCRGVLNTVHDFVIGSATSVSSDISCVSCYAENGPGVIPIQILNVINFDLVDVYQECGAAASSWCIDIPNTAISAAGVKIYGGFFSGQNPATAPAAVVHVNLATADVHVFGAHVDNHWPNPTSIVRNDSADLVSVVGSNINVVGGVVVSTTAANVSAVGNTANGVALADYYFRTSGDTADYAGNSSGGSAGVTFTNTAASGHKWLWGEIVPGHNGFRDLVQANNPWWSMSAGGGGFEGLLNHTNSANRAYNFPDATGTVPLLQSAQTWTAIQHQSSNLSQLTADASPISATSPGTTVFTFGALPVSTNFSFFCKILYNQQTAAGGVGIAVQGATNAPTRLDAWGTIYTTNPASGAPAASQGSVVNLTTTTATSVVTATPSAITTVFQAELNGTIQVGASASTLNVLMFTQAGADTVTPKAGSYCQLF